MKKKIICMLCAITLVGQMGTTVVHANNYTDTKYSISYDGSGSDMASPVRAKEDRSAAYVNNNGSGTTDIIVAVAGAKNSTSHTGSMSSYYVVGKGSRKYMSNSVYQNGYRKACLLMGTTNHKKHKMAGVWSPDNCSGY